MTFGQKIKLALHIWKNINEFSKLPKDDSDRVLITTNQIMSSCKIQNHKKADLFSQTIQFALHHLTSYYYTRGYHDGMRTKPIEDENQ